MAQQFSNFKSQIEKSGKDPAALLDELVKSGKVNKEQVDQAKSMAEMFQSILGRK